MTGPPSRDWARAYGIKRPTDLPPEDEHTDLAAWLAGRFDTLAADTPFELSDEVPG